MARAVPSVLVLLLLALAAVLVPTTPAQAQVDDDPGIDDTVIVRSVLHLDDDESSGEIVVSVQSPITTVGAVSFRLAYSDGIEPVLAPAGGPVCAIETPWVGSCGPESPDGELAVAAFALEANRPPNEEVVVRYPVTLSEPPAAVAFTLFVNVISDLNARNLPYRLEGQPQSVTVEVSVDCTGQRVTIDSNRLVIGAALAGDGFEIIPELLRTPGDQIVVIPTRWDFTRIQVEVQASPEFRLTRVVPFSGTTCDQDRDGVVNWLDNCASAWNPLQADDDGDGTGNVCAPLVLVDCDFGAAAFTPGSTADLNAAAIVASAQTTHCYFYFDGHERLSTSMFIDGLVVGPETDFASLVSLSELVIAGSGLTDLPRGIAGLPNLEKLALPGNDLAEVVPELLALPSITTLDLSDNSITALPSTISPSIKRLDLRRNQLTGDLTEFLDAWFIDGRTVGDDQDEALEIDDGPGFNDCITTTNPSASAAHGLSLIAFACDGKLAVEGRVWAPDYELLSGVQVCAERPLQDTLCVFTDIFGRFRFADVGVGNVRLTATDTTDRYDSLTTEWLGLTLPQSQARFVDLQFLTTDVGGVEPSPEPTPDPEAPEPTPDPGPAIPGTISGRFLDALGSPVFEGQVCAQLVLVGDRACSTSDANGHFSIGELTAGNYVVEAWTGDELVDSFRHAGVSQTQGVAGLELRVS